MSDPASVPPPPPGIPPQPGYTQPGYAQPGYAPPSYGQSPQYGGFAAPSVAPYAPGYANVVAPQQQPAKSSTLGMIAMILALVAAVVAPVVGAIAGWNVGSGATTQLITQMRSTMDLSILTPVRDWVLLGEISFYAGTALGIWAIVQGIIAIVQRRGRGQGIAALVVALVAPFVFGVTIYFVLVMSVATAAVSSTPFPT